MIDKERPVKELVCKGMAGDPYCSPNHRHYSSAQNTAQQSP